MSELAYRLMLARQKSLASRPPQLGDRVGFVHPEFGTWSGYIIMIITEPGQPTRCEIIVRHGSTGYPTYHWRRIDELTLLAHAGRVSAPYLRYSVRHRDEPAGETS